MKSKGICLNVSRRNDDLPEMIEEYSEKFNLSKADTVAEILRAYPKLIAYKQKVMEEESRSFGRLFSNAVWEEQNRIPRPAGMTNYCQIRATVEGSESV